MNNLVPAILLLVGVCCGWAIAETDDSTTTNTNSTVNTSTDSTARNASLLTNVDVSSAADNLSAYANYVRAESEYIQGIARARLFAAQAWLYEAMAAKEWERARQLNLWVNRMQVELRRLLRDESEDRRLIKRLEEAARRFAIAKTGKFTSGQFRSFKLLLQHAMAAKEVAAVMADPVPALGPEEFASNRAGRPAQAFRGGNVGQLIMFLGKEDLSLAPFGVAHMAVLEAMDALEQAGQDKITLMQEALQKLRDGVLDIWHPPNPNGSSGGIGGMGNFPSTFNPPNGFSIPN